MLRFVNGMLSTNARIKKNTQIHYRKNLRPFEKSKKKTRRDPSECGAGQGSAEKERYRENTGGGLL